MGRRIEQKYRERFEEIAKIIEESEKTNRILEELRTKRWKALDKESNSVEEVEKNGEELAKIREEIEKVGMAPFRYMTWVDINGDEHIGQGLESIRQHPCGTEFCLGGWGVINQLIEEGKTKENGWKVERSGVITHPGESPLSLDDFERAAKWYGLTGEEADILFYGRWHSSGLRVDNREIVKLLRGWSETGEIEI